MVKSRKTGLSQSVSIVVPVFNRADVIIDALDSVRSQTYRPIELIVVDDGSTDGSLEVVERWQRKNSSASLSVTIVRQANKGAPVARNRGLAEATGEFVAFLDSDDGFHPQFLAIMLEGLRASPASGFSTCKIDDVTERPSAFEGFSLRDIEWGPRKDVFGKTFWGTGAVVYRRELLLEIGGWNEDLRFGWQDRELCMRIQLLGIDNVDCPLELIWYRTNSMGKISTFAKNKDPRFLVGIARATRGLIRIAVERRRLRAAVWLCLRYLKWAAEACYYQMGARVQRGG